MGSDIELAAIGPESQIALAPRSSKDAIENTNTLERGSEVLAEITRRSTLKLCAIVFALFVGQTFLIALEYDLGKHNNQMFDEANANGQQLSLFVAALDATIVATAAPTISADLNSAAGYTWIGAAYLLANAASGPIWAKLSDIWGRKLIVLLALAQFFASSAVCATAKTMEALIIGRAFQGMAGGGLILLVHVCISDMFSMR
jgi:hypothetical protein